MPFSNGGCTGQLVSLYEMLRVYADRFVILGRHLEEASTVFKFVEADRIEGGNHDAALTDGEKRDLIRALTRLKAVCDQLDLPVSSGVMEVALKNPPETARELERVIHPAYIELKNQLFLFVPSPRARYYSDAWVIDADAVAAFPVATEELRHAGNCYAVGEYTACVFHCMRAAEIALWAFSNHLQVATKHPVEMSEWQTLINEIEARIKGMLNGQKSHQRDEEIRFCADANAQFFSLKEAFRKHVAHARLTYDESVAIDVLHRTHGFLKSLSARVKE